MFVFFILILNGATVKQPNFYQGTDESDSDVYFSVITVECTTCILMAFSAYVSIPVYIIWKDVCVSLPLHVIQQE